MKTQFTLCLMIALIAGASTCASAQGSIPPNAMPNYSGGWSCNLGYRRTGDRCEQINVPENATPSYSGGWSCNLGYKKLGQKCAEMTLEEKAIQDAIIRAMIARGKAKTIVVDDYEFTLSDVERRCDVYVWDKTYGEPSCSGDTRIVARRCEVYIYSWPHGELSCRGSELSVVERNCSVYMYSDQYGDITC